MVEPFDQLITILLVENDPGDRELTRRALDSLNVDVKVADDGLEAFEYLKRTGRHRDPIESPRPDLILLDLNMPRMNGQEFLQRFNADPDLSLIPVVVLTTSQQETDILRSYDLGCSSYIQKPVDTDQFINAAQELGRYWFDSVKFPTMESLHIENASLHLP